MVEVLLGEVGPAGNVGRAEARRSARSRGRWSSRRARYSPSSRPPGCVVVSPRRSKRTCCERWKDDGSTPPPAGALIWPDLAEHTSRARLIGRADDRHLATADRQSCRSARQSELRWSRHTDPGDLTSPRPIELRVPAVLTPGRCAMTPETRSTPDRAPAGWGLFLGPSFKSGPNVSAYEPQRAGRRA